MDLFEELRKIALKQHEESQFPVWLLDDVMAIAGDPVRHADKTHLVEMLIAQISNFDLYAGAGCFDTSVGVETIRTTIGRINGCAENVELEPILEAVRKRYAELTDESCERRHLLNRLRNLARFGAEPLDYEEHHRADLPKELEIGFAICHPECGNQAFVVVEGGPQGCDWCGGTMLPVVTRTYRLTSK